MTSANPHTHDSGPHDPSRGQDGPVYWECATCGFLSHDPAFRDAPTHKCPACGSATGDRRIFPPERLRRVDERIRRYNADGESEVVVILAATFLESLLEDMLARIMASEGASVKLRAAVLDTLRSVGQRIGKLFPTLTGVQFEDAATEAGLPEFPRRWRALRSERNAFIHDAAFEGAREELGTASAKEAIELLDQAYKLFVRINNRFVAEPRAQAQERDVAPVLTQALARLTGGNYEIIYREVDKDTLAALLVFPKEKAAEAKALLYGKNIGELRLPASVADKPVNEAFAIIRAKQRELPGEIRGIERIKVPSFTGAIGSANAITLRWSSPSGAMFSNIYRAESETGSFALLESVQAETYTDKKVEEGKSYFYRIAAVGKDLNHILLKEAERKGAQAIVTICPLCQFNLDIHQGEIRSGTGASFDMPILLLPQILGWALGGGWRALGLHRSISGRRLLEQWLDAPAERDVYA